ncbi:hypothetical protein [Rhodopila sp.]|uniref:hypothetical protein n=1 Tax=Rhodopila sp. TaxID=2480087 RepID=UPI003D0EF177
MVAAFCLTAAAMAQTPGGGSVPREEGNRANGLDYQPTPSEVVPRERAAGIQPPAAQQKANNRFLQQTDKKLLQGQGLSTKSVPQITPEPTGNGPRSADQAHQ